MNETKLDESTPTVSGDARIPNRATVGVKVTARVGGCDVSLEWTADSSSLKESLVEALRHLSEIGLEPKKPVVPGPQDAIEEQASEVEDDDDPISKLAREVELPAPDVKKVLGIKGQSIQLFRANQYNVSDSVCVICFAFEKGLGQLSMPLQTFTSLLAANHIKMKTPVAALCFNLIRDGKIDKARYDTSREIVLSSAGENVATTLIRRIVSGEAPNRRAKGRRRPAKSRKGPRPSTRR